jgi:hypothetical protein
MLYANPEQNWTEWRDNADAAKLDDATKLAALREYIAATAREYVNTERGLTAEWMNKNLAALGVPERIAVEAVYYLTAAVTGTVTTRVYGHTRAEAADKIRFALDGSQRHVVSAVTLVGDPTFTSGPADPASGAVDLDAPTTVQDTLIKLREAIMLAHVSGPKICSDSANEVLAQYGLGPLPAMKTFMVKRPVTATAVTTVSAWDEESAMRVAGHRWDADRYDYTVVDLAAMDAPQLVVAEEDDL